MRVFDLVFILFLSAAPSFAGWACKTDPKKPPNPKRWDSQINIELRGKGSKMDLSSKIGSGDCTKTEAWDWNDHGKKLTATTKIPQDGKLVKKTGKTAGVSYKCDHIVELNMLKQIMEMDGGACDEAQKLVAAGNVADAQKKLLAIRKSISGKNNLFFFQENAEKLKTDTVTNQALLASYDYFKITALYDYVAGAGPGSRILSVANAIDKEILAQFPSAAYPKAGTPDSVAGLWGKYSLQVRAFWRIITKAAEKKVRTMQCTPPAGGGGSTLTHRDLLQAAGRLVRRHGLAFGMPISINDSSSSSLMLRAARRSAARSGPHAPPGQSCPRKGAPQKKVINRSQTKTKPPPAKKPRQPATRPKPRPANPKKKVAKRPATRARRQVGKQQKPKRTTPKRKPKVVPKPTRRPKGKARPRRRK